jgi:hypothetical protein
MHTLETIKTIKGIDTRFDIVKETKKECFDEFFRLNNRLKYCNDHYYLFIHQSDRDYYKEWNTIDNYSRCGGDMW